MTNKEWNKGKNNPLWHKHHSAETKKKIGRAISDSWQNPNSKFNLEEFKIKKSLDMVKKWQNPNSIYNSQEYRRGLSERRKKYLQDPNNLQKLRERLIKNNPAKRPEVAKKISEAMKGRKASIETRQKLSKAHKGRIVWNKGLTKETDERVKKTAEKRKGYHHSKRWKKEHSRKITALWKTQRYRNLVVENALKGLKITPNRPEQIMMQIIRENNFPFEWVGDGKATIEGFSPDFVYLNQIIEVFGDYWHRRREVIERDNRKLRAYASLGYKTLVIWEHELKEPQKVAERIFSFVKANESICQLKGGIEIR